MRKHVAAYAVSLAALAGALLLRWLLDPLLGDQFRLLAVFGAVAVAVWAGGWLPASCVALMGYLGSAFLFVRPASGAATFFNLTGFVAFAFNCSLIIGFGEAMRRALVRADRRLEVLRVTLRSIGDAVITTDVEGRIDYLNTVAEALTGWKHAEALRQPLDSVFRIINEETRETVENPAAKALREGVSVGLANHTLLVRKDGSELPIDDSAAPIKNEFGEVSGCVLIFRDVAARRQLQRENAERLQAARMLASIVESSDDAIVSKTLDGIIRSWNAGAERLFGHSAEYAVGKHISLVIPPERISEEDMIVSKLKSGHRVEHFETERLHRDGQRVPVSLTISPMRDDTGNVVGASKIVRDITRQRRAEIERARLVAVIETSTDFIGICDLAGIPLFINRAGLALVGLDDIEQARATPVREFFFPEDQSRVMERFFPSVLRDGHGEIEVRFRNFKTGAAHWMAYKVLALTDANGRPNSLATVSQDISERKRLEENLRRAADDLSDADRRKNEFLAVLAHELRNPLAPISNAVQVLRLGASNPGVINATVPMLERQVRQMVRLVDDLMDMSRISRGKIELRKERVELAAVVGQAVEATRATYQSMNHQLTLNLPAQPIYLQADPIRLAQVIGNLLNNACKFTDQGGQIALSASADGDLLVLRVRDTGVGIDAQQMPNIFDMFTQADSSLERSRDGLGIGLTLVKTLVEMHGGSVQAYSEGSGHGSEFVIRLPVASDMPESATTMGTSGNA